MTNEFPAYPRLVRPAPDPLALYLRIGRNDHTEALALAAAGDLGCFGVVFDPIYVERHKELRDQVLSRVLHAILDPKTQQSATPGGYNEALGKLPWGVQRPHMVADFVETTGRRLIAELGDFTLEHGFTQVLAPTHLLRSAEDEWLKVDIDATRRLREHLDRKNGGKVEIIYSLAITYAMLRDPEQRRHVINMLQGIPASAVWLKVDGFGSDSTPTGVRSYIDASADFHALGLPVVADHAGGIVGLSLLAFGATGGLAHGVTQAERFNAQSWRHPRIGDGFSAHPRVYVQPIDLLLKPTDARLLFEASTRAKGLFGCRDSGCCHRGITDMLQNPARHFIYQRIQEVKKLSLIPEQLRAQRFLDQHLRPATDLALAAANMNWRDEFMAKRTHKKRIRLDALRVVLGDYEINRQKQPPVYLPKTRASREAHLSA